MLHGVCRPFALALASFAALAILAAPASAQQLVDGGKEGTGGGLAFVLFAVMVFIIAGCLFFMDRVRKRRVQPEETE